MLKKERKGPQHTRKIFEAAAESETQEEREYRRWKYEQLPNALDGLKGAKQKRDRYVAVVDARKHSALVGEKAYTSAQRAVDEERLQDLEHETFQAEKACEYWRKKINGYEEGRVRAVYDSSWNEIRAAVRRGTREARALFANMRRMFTLFDAVREQESLFTMAARHMSRARLQLLRDGAELPEEPVLHFPIGPSTFCAFLTRELPSRDRTPEPQWTKIFPHGFEVLREEPPLALEETGLDPDDTIPRECLLQEEDDRTPDTAAAPAADAADADARIEQRLARQARAESVKHRAARRTAKKRKTDQGKTADQARPKSDHPWRGARACTRRAVKGKKSSRARARAA